MAKKETTSGKTTRALPCSCKSEQQDAMYGRGNRLHNRTKKDTHRCTVCGSTK